MRDTSQARAALLAALALAVCALALCAGAGAAHAASLLATTVAHTPHASGLTLGILEAAAIAGALLSGYGVLAKVIHALWLDNRRLHDRLGELAELRRADSAEALPALSKAGHQIATNTEVLTRVSEALARCEGGH